jgi:NDP-sugar pyrophosphorylase family protein
MLMQGMPLDGYVFDDFWQDLGTPERIAQAEAKLASGEVKLRYL